MSDGSRENEMLAELIWVETPANDQRLEQENSFFRLQVQGPSVQKLESPNRSRAYPVQFMRLSFLPSLSDDWKNELKVFIKTTSFGSSLPSYY